MREDLHVSQHQPRKEPTARPKDDRIKNLIKQHRERLDQIELYYLSGGLTAEQAENLLEGRR